MPPVRPLTCSVLAAPCDRDDSGGDHMLRLNRFATRDTIWFVLSKWVTYAYSAC